MDQQTDRSIRSSDQGLFMIMTNGLGASVGTWVAGTFVVNRFVDMSSPNADALANLAGWHQSWFIFAGYALVISILFMLLFRSPKKSNPQISLAKADTIGGGDPEGMAGVNGQVTADKKYSDK